MSLIISELQIGEAYTTIGKDVGYTFIHDGDSTCVSYIYYGTYHTGGHLSSIDNISFSFYEKASEIDKAWLVACIEAKRTVPKPVEIPSLIKNNYSLY